MADTPSLEDIQNVIDGVEFKVLKSWPDDRGFFRELIRNTDPVFQMNGTAADSFAQWSHSKMAKNTVKAWHFHHLQTDWWYVPIGFAEVVLFDLREESPTYQEKINFKLGEPELDPEALVAVVKIPPGVAHGCKVMSDFAHLFYITSQTYNPNDEGRHPFNSTVVPHSWGSNEDELIVAPNDRKTFVPTADRKKIR